MQAWEKGKEDRHQVIGYVRKDVAGLRESAEREGQPELRNGVKSVEEENIRVGTQVRVQLDYREATHWQGQVGTIKKRHGTPEYAAFEVSFPDGQLELFWDHQLQEAKKPSGRRTWWFLR